MSVTIELWRDGIFVGCLPKTNLEAAKRTAWVIVKTGEYRPTVVCETSDQSTEDEK